MKIGTPTTASKVLLIPALMLSVIGQLLQIDDKCAYADQNFVNDCTGDICQVRFSVHSLPANDLVDQYIGQIDTTTVYSVDSTCLKTKFGNKPEYDGYFYAIPLTKTTRANIEPSYPSFPDNSCIFLPKGDKNILTFSKVEEALKSSPFNMDFTKDGAGMIITRNDNGGLSFVLRGNYNINTTNVTADTTFKDSYCPKPKEKFYRNCAVVHGNLYNNETYSGPRDHFFSTFKINFNLWVGVSLALLYFIWALGTSVHDPLNPHYQNNSMFNYPLYSIWVFGNQRQTKISRLTLLLMSVTSYWLACSIISWKFQWNTEWKRMLLAAVIGVVFSWIVTRIFSFILMGLNNVHHDFLDEIKKCDNHEAREACLDRYDNRRLSWNYLFYTLAFGYFTGTFWVTIAFNLYFDNTKFWYLMASFGICLGSELFFFDWIPVILGRGTGCIGKIYQSRGYFIDYELHKNWDQYVSDEE